MDNAAFSNSTPSDSSIAVKSIEELDKSKLYHFTVEDKVPAEEVNVFMLCLKEEGIRALVTSDGIKAREIKELFKKLPNHKKLELLAILQEAEPSKIIH